MASTVIVMCKLPTGIILDMPNPDGGPDRTVRLNGANHPEAVLGAGLTYVDAEFWAAWRERNKGFDPLETGAIWAAEREGDAKAQAKEMKGHKTGFEGLDPDKPMPGVEPTEEQKKENDKIQKKD